MNQEFVTFPDDAMLSVKELAQYLHIGQENAYELVKEGSVPSVRFGRLYRIPFWGLKDHIVNQAGVSAPPKTTPRIVRH